MNNKECQFKKYGFETNKMVHILSTVEDKILGYFDSKNEEEEKIIVPAIWDLKTGILDQREYLYSYSIAFNLTPIKKPWYEDESNKGKLIVHVNSDSLCTFHKLTKYVIKAIPIGTTSLISFNAEEYRLSTKEEVLSLYKEVK